MKVALVVRRLSRNGGTERVALGLARHLAEAGDAVTAWVLEPGERVPGVTQRRLPGPPVRGRVPRMLRVAWGAARVVGQAPGAVLGLVRAPGFPVWRAGGGCHAAWLDAAQRRMGAAERIDLALDQRAARSAGRVVVNSRMAGEQLVDRYGVPADRVTLVRNGVDLDRFQPDGHPRGQRVVFLGNGWARKGLSAALLAMRDLPGATLDVWGHEADPGPYERAAARLAVADRVAFRGPCARPDRVLPGYDALVLPTRYDPLANVCLEALACGVPVVTTAANGAAEVLPEPAWVAGDPDDGPGLARALERALHSTEAPDRSRAAAEALPARAAFDRLRSLLVESIA